MEHMRPQKQSFFLIEMSKLCQKTYVVKRYTLCCYRVSMLIAQKTPARLQLKVSGSKFASILKQHSIRNSRRSIILLTT